MPENTELLEEISPHKIIDIISEGAQIYSSVTEDFIKNFVFYDKTLYQWATTLMVDIPKEKDLDPQKYRTMLIQVAQNTQIASNYFSLACSMADAVAGGNSIKKSDVVTAIVNNYAKQGATRPAATVIEKMAESYMSSTISARVASKIVKNFWKQRLDTLLELRRIFEQLGMSLNVEIKWTSQ